jgi:hypothetical protein
VRVPYWVCRRSPPPQAVSGFQPAVDGQLTLLSPATGTSPGTVDTSASRGGGYLYVQTGANEIVDEYQVNANDLERDREGRGVRRGRR